MKNFQNIGFDDYMQILRRRIWYVILTAVLATAATFVWVSRLVSVYKSETTIQVNARLLPTEYIDSIVRDTATDRLEFVKQTVKSRTFAERIVQEFQLGGPNGANQQASVSAVVLLTEFTPVSNTTFKVGYSSPDPVLARNITRRLAEAVIQLNTSVRQDTAFVADQFLDEQLRQAETDL